MATDVLRVESNERIDQDDFEFAVQRSIEDNSRHLADQMLCPAAGQKTWILSGFGMSNPSGNLLQIDRGVAILPRRDGARIVEALLTSEGDASKTLDLSGYVAAVHGVYIQFVYQAAETESRTFWNPSTEEEYAQSITTRLQAAWDMRVEQVSPGSEWFKIGEVNPSTMAITDQRDFYFEGKVSDTYAADGWGTANDRNSDRQQYGISDLQTFTEAMRTIVEELRSSSGNRRWWEAGVRDLDIDNGPLRVGFTGGTPPADDSVMVGDVNLALILTGGNGYLRFDDTDQFWYDRSANQFKWDVGGSTALLLTSSTLYIQGDNDFAFTIVSDAPRIIYDSGDFMRYDRAAGKLGWWFANSEKMELYNTGLTHQGGLRVGFTGTPGGVDRIEIGNANSYVENASGTYGLKLNFDTDDYLALNRGTPESLELYMDSTVQFRVAQGGGGRFLNGLRVNSASMPSASRLEIEDANFYMQLVSSNPRVGLDTDDYLEYHRTNNTWSLYIATTKELEMSATALNLQGNNLLGATLGNVTSALAVGYTQTTPTAGYLLVGDDNHSLALVSSKPRWTVDSAQYLEYDRATDSLELWIGGQQFVELRKNGNAGELGLRDSSTTIHYVDGDELEVLHGLGQLGTPDHNFIVSGLGIYYNDTNPDRVYLKEGIAYIGGDLVYASTISADLSTNGGWVSGTKPTYDSPDVTWAWMFVDTDGGLFASRYPPQLDSGRLNASETPGGGKTVYDYVCVGSVQYRNQAATHGVEPFFRAGDFVYMGGSFRSYYTIPIGFTDTDETAKTSEAKTASFPSFDNHSELFPSAGIAPYTTAIAWLAQAKVEVTDSAQEQEMLFYHGGGASPLIKTATMHFRGPASGTEEHGDVPLTFKIYAPTSTVTYARYSQELQSAGTRVLTVEMRGYIEPLNREMSHLQYP